MGKKSKKDRSEFERIAKGSFEVTKNAIDEFQEKIVSNPDASPETKEKWRQEASKKIDDFFATDKEGPTPENFSDYMQNMIHYNVEIKPPKKKTRWQRFKGWIKNLF